jgi:hypothetical protein
MARRRLGGAVAFRLARETVEDISDQFANQAEFLKPKTACRSGWRPQT